jgi:hypothetical protein
VKSQRENKRKPAKFARPESRASEKFDEQLFNRKLSEELSDLPMNFVDATFRTLLKSHETGVEQFPMYFVNSQLALLRDRRLVGVDRVGREVWQVHQGKAVTPEFVRDILVPKAMEQIAVVEAYITDARATGNITWEPGWAYLAMELGRLKSEIVERYTREMERPAPASTVVNDAEEKSIGTRRKRSPDKNKHSERVEFEDGLRSELTAILTRIEESSPTISELRERFPEFRLWTILSNIEQNELLETEFKPGPYARILTARKFGVGAEAIKKSRQKSHQ